MVPPSLLAELMSSFAVVLWSCLYTYDLEDILSTHGSQVVTHTCCTATIYKQHLQRWLTPDCLFLHL